MARFCYDTAVMAKFLTALRVTNPAEWRYLVTTALFFEGGRVPEAAKALGVSTRTLFRWLQDPLLERAPRAPSCLHRDPNVIEKARENRRA